MTQDLPRIPGDQPMTKKKLPIDFTAFHQAHRPAYLRWATTYLNHRADAEEAVDAAFEQLLTTWPTVLSMESPAGYAWSVLRSRTIDIARARGRRPALLDAAAFETTALRDTVDPIGQLEESLNLFHAIGKLPPRQMDVVVLLHVHDLSVDQVAAELGITPRRSTVERPPRQASPARDTRPPSPPSPDPSPPPRSSRQPPASAPGSTDAPNSPTSTPPPAYPSPPTTTPPGATTAKPPTAQTGTPSATAEPATSSCTKPQGVPPLSMSAREPCVPVSLTSTRPSPAAWRTTPPASAPTPLAANSPVTHPRRRRHPSRLRRAAVAHRPQPDPHGRRRDRPHRRPDQPRPADRHGHQFDHHLPHGPLP